ncbi:MAG: hypothetical protein ACO2PM_13145 [Pyrobaculum sp.]|jgi:hypothetical protein
MLRPVRVVGLDTSLPRMFASAGPYVPCMTPAESPSELCATLNKHLVEADVKSVFWIHFIKHRQTLGILRTEFPELLLRPNHATYRYVPGYALRVAVLKRRRHMYMPESPGDLAYCLVTVKQEPP